MLGSVRWAARRRCRITPPSPGSAPAPPAQPLSLRRLPAGQASRAEKTVTLAQTRDSESGPYAGPALEGSEYQVMWCSNGAYWLPASSDAGPPTACAMGKRISEEVNSCVEIRTTAMGRGLFLTQNVCAGQIVVKEPPLLLYVVEETKSEVCAWCYRMAEVPGTELPLRLPRLFVCDI